MKKKMPPAAKGLFLKKPPFGNPQRLLIMKKGTWHLIFIPLFFAGFLLQAGTTAAKPLEEPGENASLSEKVDARAEYLRKYSLQYPKESVEYGRQALDMLENLPANSGNKSKKIKILSSMCLSYGLLGKFGDALAAGKTAVELARNIGDQKDIAIACGSMANIYLKLGDFDTALRYSLTARKASEAIDYKIGTLSALVSIARVHRHLKEYEKSLSCYEEAIRISRSLDRKPAEASILANIANIYWEQKQHKKALDYYYKSLKIMEESNMQMRAAVLWSNIAYVYSDTGEHQRALQYDLKSLAVLEKFGDKANIARVHGSLGRDYRGLGDYEKALAHLDKALELALPMGIKDITRDIYEEYTRTYEAMGDFKQAFFYRGELKKISDQILNESKTREIAHMEVLYDIKKKEKENQLLKQKNNVQRNFLVLVIALALMIAAITYNRFRIRARAEKKLRESREKLEKTNAAKDKLFTIIAHDLGNPLNSLLLSSGYLQREFPGLSEKDLREYINHIYKQSSGMSDLLQNLLQWARVQIGKMELNPEEVGLLQVTEETMEQVDFAAHKKEIHIDTDIREDSSAWADKHMTRTVLRNLVGNAIKYTRPGGEVRVTAREDGQKVTITVSDNGVGMEPNLLAQLFHTGIHESQKGTANEKGTGLGLVLCKELIERQGGEIQVQSTPGQGSDFSFTLPNYSKKTAV